MSEEINWRDGDIYFWSWKKPSDYMAYHCCARKAIVRGKYLCDIFWSSSDGRHWTKEQALEELNLEYMGNVDGLEKIDDWKADYYDLKDIVNLNHSNSSSDNVYRRKDAGRSKEVMLERAKYLQERAESDIRSAT